MVYGTLSKNSENNLSHKGFTYIEMLVVLAMLAIISSTAFLFIRPGELRMKARDEKRLSDLTTLERIISEYRVDNGYLPDIPSVLRTSNNLPSGSSGPLSSSSGGGWIPVDLSMYHTKLPVDPLNEGQFFYSYFTDGYSFELNAKLEILTEFEQDDGGNDSGLYEVGDALSLI